MAFESIAQRYVELSSRAADHVRDIGGKRRIGIDIVPDLAGGDAEAHRQPEDVDKFLAGMPDKMRADNTVG